MAQVEVADQVGELRPERGDARREAQRGRDAFERRAVRAPGELARRELRVRQGSFRVSHGPKYLG
jgi:hypothetical protein